MDPVALRSFVMKNAGRLTPGRLTADQHAELIAAVTGVPAPRVVPPLPPTGAEGA